MIDLELVTQLCRRATEATGGVVLDVVCDPLDESLWVRMSSWPQAQDALTALLAHGLSAVDRSDSRLQVTGWDVRLLRRRLGMLLAGVDDLREEWAATAELTCYHRDRRTAAGEAPEDFEVLADVEIAMRGAVPIPHRAPGTNDLDTLLQLIAAAEDAYQQLIAEHLDYAAQVLAGEPVPRPSS
jgi:hypothetical protein